MNEKLGAILSKSTVFKDVEKMEGSRVSQTFLDYLAYLVWLRPAKKSSHARSM